MSRDDEPDSRTETESREQRDAVEDGDPTERANGGGDREDGDPEETSEGQSQRTDEMVGRSDEHSGETASTSGNDAEYTTPLSERDAEHTVAPARESSASSDARTGDDATGTPTEEIDDEGQSDDGPAGDDESNGRESFVTTLSDEELSSWASAAAKAVTSDNESDVNPRQHAPERLQRGVEEVERRLQKRLRQDLEGRRELARRRAAYIDQLEARVQELDRELESAREDHERERSQLSTLLDRKEDEIEKLKIYGHERLVGPVIFQLRENLQGALAHEDPEKLREGVELSLAELDDVLRREDVEIIEPDDDPDLDRDRHHPVRTVEDARPEKTVVGVERAGFAIDGDVREKARVVVSDGSGEHEDEETAYTADERDGSGETTGTDERSQGTAVDESAVDDQFETDEVTETDTPETDEVTETDTPETDDGGTESGRGARDRDAR